MRASRKRRPPFRRPRSSHLVPAGLFSSLSGAAGAVPVPTARSRARPDGLAQGRWKKVRLGDALAHDRRCPESRGDRGGPRIRRVDDDGSLRSKKAEGDEDLSPALTVREVPVEDDSVGMQIGDQTDGLLDLARHAHHREVFSYEISRRCLAHSVVVIDDHDPGLGQRPPTPIHAVVPPGGTVLGSPAPPYQLAQPLASGT